MVITFTRRILPSPHRPCCLWHQQKLPTLFLVPTAPSSKAVPRIPPRRFYGKKTSHWCKHPFVNCAKPNLGAYCGQTHHSVYCHQRLWQIKYGYTQHHHIHFTTESEYKSQRNEHDLQRRFTQSERCRLEHHLVQTKVDTQQQHKNHHFPQGYRLLFQFGHQFGRLLNPHRSHQDFGQPQTHSQRKFVPQHGLLRQQQSDMESKIEQRRFCINCRRDRAILWRHPHHHHREINQSKRALLGKRQQWLC